jgi:RNA polymerase sigma factor (sigma-70 family)
MNTSPDLLRRAAAGDDAAWREIVGHYQRLVHATIRSFRVSPSDAEDLFQETFLRLYRHAAWLRDSRALTRWLIVTTRNLCLDHIARARVRAHEELDEETAAVEAIPLTEMIHLERAQAVREEIQGMPERCRELLWLLYFQQESPDYEAAARAFHMPLGSVGPTRMRCLDQLLLRLRRRGIDS